MTWRAMRSLLVLRDQVNALYPDRLKGADGLVGDAAHQAETSDHNPHYVAGVGTEIVTALDLTHDPAHGFDSYAFAEILRQHRDPRLKYVISNHRIFDSAGSDAFVWRSYSGDDPHTNHVHVSVLDAIISDTATPWNLGGPTGMTPAEFVLAYDANGTFAARLKAAAWGYQDAGQPSAHNILLDPTGELRGGLKKISAQAAANGGNVSTLLASNARIESALARIEAALVDVQTKLDEKPTLILPSGVTFANTAVTWTTTQVPTT